MSGLIEKALNKYCVICQTDGSGKGHAFYGIFRILIGLMFFQHGVQKLFGAFGGITGNGEPVANFLSLLGLAGIIEFFGGLAVILGLFTRLAALISTLEMAVAYFMAHFPQGFYSIANGGEMAVLFLASFLLITRMGAGRWSLEKKLTGKEIF